MDASKQKVAMPDPKTLGTVSQMLLREYGGYCVVVKGNDGTSVSQKHYASLDEMQAAIVGAGCYEIFDEYSLMTPAERRQRERVDVLAQVCGEGVAAEAEASRHMDETRGSIDSYHSRGWLGYDLDYAEEDQNEFTPYSGYDLDYAEEDQNEFTPYSGYYYTGNGDRVYMHRGEDRDFSACDAECGYCGRCIGAQNC